jgi:tetratricopeptide (TPR) repeat protein
MAAEGMWMRVVRGNWHLLLLMALILVAAVVFASRPRKAVDAEAAMLGGEVAVELSGGEDSAPYKEESRWAQPTQDARFQAGIVKYEREVQFNRGSAETPANLFKLANLYFMTSDYKNATKYYAALMAEYPRFEGMRYVFQNLVVCYDKLGNLELKRNVLRQMMSYFPPDAPEYKFAEQELGL